MPLCWWHCWGILVHDFAVLHWFPWILCWLVLFGYREGWLACGRSPTLFANTVLAPLVAPVPYLLFQSFPSWLQPFYVAFDKSSAWSVSCRWKADALDPRGVYWNPSKFPFIFINWPLLCLLHRQLIKFCQWFYIWSHLSLFRGLIIECLLWYLSMNLSFTMLLLYLAEQNRSRYHNGSWWCC